MLVNEPHSRRRSIEVLSDYLRVKLLYVDGFKRRFNYSFTHLGFPVYARCSLKNNRVRLVLSVPTETIGDHGVMLMKVLLTTFHGHRSLYYSDAHMYTILYLHACIYLYDSMEYVPELDALHCMSDRFREDVVEVSQCCVCLDFVSADLRTGCNHVVCRPCAFNWSNTTPKLTCPMCRTEFSQE